MSNRFFPNYDTYIITSPFGMRTLKGTTKMHNGIDLVAKAPGGYGALDHIKAHTGGKVIASGYDNSAGYLVKIQTALNVVMVYYHLREASPFKVGDTVKTGDIIGFMGATGNVTGAHLHFGIQVNGSWVDPAPYLDRDYGAKAETEATVKDLPVLKRGAKGDTVKILQLILNFHMDGNLEIDGSFGPATENAVEAFQEDTHLEADGHVGPKTWAVLMGVAA